MDVSTATEDDICRSIRASVLEQRLTPGTKLAEEALSDIFGVGRSVVRKALQTLASDNIIELRRNRGAVIASPSADEAAQVFRARRVIEAALIEDVVKYAGPADVSALKTHLAQEDAALERGDVPNWIRLTGEFHFRLAEIADNRPMAGFLEQLIFQSSLIIALYGSGNRTCSGGDHRALVEVIAAGDNTEAARILDAHLAAIEAQLVFSTPDVAKDLASVLTRPETGEWV